MHARLYTTVRVWCVLVTVCYVYDVYVYHIEYLRCVRWTIEQRRERSRLGVWWRELPSVLIFHSLSKRPAVSDNAPAQATALQSIVNTALRCSALGTLLQQEFQCVVVSRRNDSMCMCLLLCVSNRLLHTVFVHFRQQTDSVGTLQSSLTFCVW